MPAPEGLVEYWAALFRKNGIAAFLDAGLVVPDGVAEMNDTHAVAHFVLSENGAFDEW